MAVVDYRTALALGALLALAGCASEGTKGNTSHLDVTATPSTTLCTQSSPELQVYGTPHGATHYRVRLLDLNDPEEEHGEAEVSVNPEGIIPAGALDHYTPPCPPLSGHSYQYEVRAVNDLGRALATGAYVITM